MAFSSYSSIQSMASKALGVSGDTFRFLTNVGTLTSITQGGCGIDNSGNMIISGGTSVWYSHNIGVTWTQATIPTTSYIGNVDMRGGGYAVLISGSPSYIGALSSDYGVTWTAIPTSSGYNPSAGTVVDCTIDTTGQYITMNSKAGGFWTSTNGGTTFTKVFSSVSNCNCTSANGTCSYILGTTNEYSTNHLSTWSSSGTASSPSYGGCIDDNNQLVVIQSNPVCMSTTGGGGTFFSTGLAISTRNAVATSCSSNGNVACICSSGGVAYYMLNKSGTWVNINAKYGIAGNQLACAVSPNGKYILFIGVVGIYLYTFENLY